MRVWRRPHRAATIRGMIKSGETRIKTLAIHTVWTTYLTWLPGDKRGHWSPLFDLYGGLLRNGHQLNMGDEGTRKTAANLATGKPKYLRDSEIDLAAQTIAEVIRGGSAVGVANGVPAAAWTVYAAALEKQHVHLLLAANAESVSRVVGRIKGKSSSRIGTADGNPGQRVWTAGFWRVFLFDSNAVQVARNYITNHNTRRGMAPDPFNWITPPPPK
ncbi:MAG: transposase [Phycisphaerae bacterium]